MKLQLRDSFHRERFTEGRRFEQPKQPGSCSPTVERLRCAKVRTSDSLDFTAATLAAQCVPGVSLSPSLLNAHNAKFIAAQSGI